MWIDKLEDDEIFVFGSNDHGIHGAGAAKQAMKWGAVYGQGFGHYGETFAIPTKDMKVDTLPINIIKLYVDVFIRYAQNHPELKFLLTEIGTGLAGLKHEEIAPLFKNAPKNVIMTEKWRDINEKLDISVI